MFKRAFVFYSKPSCLMLMSLNALYQAELLDDEPNALYRT